MSQQTVSIELPIPPRALSPNGRAHWRAQLPHKHAQRSSSAVQAAAALRCKRPMWVYAQTTIKWYAKDGNHPDHDNALASIKSGLDGLKDAGLLADDKHLSHNRIEFFKDPKNPRVVISISRGEG